MNGDVAVTFIGSGDAFGSGGRLQACILLDDGRHRILLDCGASSLIGLKRLGIHPNSIDTVIVSHLHGDHFAGIPFMILDGQFSRREAPLRVVGPIGSAARLEAAMEVLYPGSSGIKRRFETTVEESATGSVALLSNGTVQTFLADHASGAPAHHLRIQLGGITIAYSGDSAWTSTLVEAAGKADLLICEAYMHERAVPFHLSYRELFEHRHELTCQRIILTHMAAEMLSAANIEFERAYDGLVVELHATPRT